MTTVGRNRYRFVVKLKYHRVSVLAMKTAARERNMKYSQNTNVASSMTLTPCATKFKVSVYDWEATEESLYF
jgi:hypothetical protein